MRNFTQHILLLTFLLTPFLSNGQSGANNLDFENWGQNLVGSTVPSGFAASDSVKELTAGVQSGSSALRVETVNSSTLGQVIGLCQLSSITPFGSVINGEDYTKRPDSAKGYVRAETPSSDTAVIYFQLTKYDAATDSTHIVGNAITIIPDSVKTWQEISIPFVYDTCATPDTIEAFFVSEGATLFGIGSKTIGGRMDLDGWQLLTPAPSIDNVVQNDVVCGNDGSIEIQASNVDSCTEYSIDGGSTYTTDSIFTGLTSGTYQAEVKTANGTDNLSVTVSGDSVAVDSVSTSAATCGLSDGSLTIHASGGASPYQFSKDSGNSFQSDSTFGPTTSGGLSSGIYDIAVKDANNCVYYGQATVPANTSLSIDSFTKVREACGQKDGRMTVHASGGNTPYNYQIDGGGYQPDSTFTGLSAGNHNVSVQDAAGCTIDTLNVYLDSATAPSISNVNINDATCGMSDGELNVTASGGNGGYMYSNDGGMGYQNSSQFTGLAAGNYKVMVRDTNMCEDSMTVTLDTAQVPMADSAKAGKDTVDLVNGGNVSFDSWGTGDSIYWEFGDGSDTSGQNVSHTYNSTGSYSVMVIYEIGNCTDTAMTTVEVVNTSSIERQGSNAEAEITLRPNPSSGQFKVEMARTRSGSIEVLDLTGRVVHERSLTNSDRVQLDLSGQEEGVYFVRLRNTNDATLNVGRVVLSR